MNIHFDHPYPRYGFVAALVDLGWGLPDALDWEQLRDLAVKGIENALSHVMVYTVDNPINDDELRFGWVDTDQINPGKANGQIAAFGYFLAPNALTSDGPAANTVKEARALVKKLKACKTERDLYKPYKLKRSFAPLTAKVNNGRKSAAEPPASLRDAAFTCVATLTKRKPAAYIVAGNNFFNAALIPDLPLEKTKEWGSPLYTFAKVFSSMQETAMGDLMRAEVKSEENSEKRKYNRPLLHNGNYPHAPRNRALNAVSVVAAAGVWAREKECSISKRVWAVLRAMENQPLYIVSYEGSSQERFGHHLVELAQDGYLADIQRALLQVNVYGVSFKDPKWNLFQRAATHLLQFYTQATFRDFLAFRGEYPPALAHLFSHYFSTQKNMQNESYPPKLVTAARAFGQAINSAAFRSAANKEEEDRKHNRSGLTMREYKARILTEIESRVFGAKSKAELASNVSVTVGRMTGGDFPEQAGDFFDLVLTTDEITVRQAQQLLTAFMRLRSASQQSPTDGARPVTAKVDAPTELED